VVPTNTGYIGFTLKKGGYARLNENGEVHSSAMFFDVGFPSYERVLQDGGDCSLTCEQVDMFLLIAVAKLEDALRVTTERKGWLARTEFGGIAFEDYLKNPKLGELPVSESAIAVIESLLRSANMSRAQRNLLMLLIFGEPVRLL